MTDPKPLNFAPTPGVGYSVIRRGDGGMTLTFTDLSDATLKHWHDFALEHLKRLETALGRVPNFQNGPRLIDIDILFYDDLVLDTAALVIPHPRLHERAFVLVPLADIAPDLIHPVLHKSVHELLRAITPQGIQLIA